MCNYLWGNLICESLWVFARRSIEVKAIELIRAAVVSCSPSRVRVIEEYSDGSLRVLVEVVSKESCVEYLSPVLKYVLGDDVRILSSSCGSVPLPHISTGKAG